MWVQSTEQWRALRVGSTKHGVANGCERWSEWLAWQARRQSCVATAGTATTSRKGVRRRQDLWVGQHLLRLRRHQFSWFKVENWSRKPKLNSSVFYFHITDRWFILGNNWTNQMKVLVQTKYPILKYSKIMLYQFIVFPQLLFCPFFMWLCFIYLNFEFKKMATSNVILKH
jgi:hypothetical protein